jgi:restriction endonuclease Mrr
MNRVDQQALEKCQLQDPYLKDVVQSNSLSFDSRIEYQYDLYQTRRKWVLKEQHKCRHQLMMLLQMIMISFPTP